MNKIFITACVVALILSVNLFPAYAEKVDKATLQKERDAIHTEAFQRIHATSSQPTAPENTKDERLDRIVAQGEKMKQRLDAAITRLEHIVTRLDSRITKIEQAGTLLTESKNLSAKTRTELTDARIQSATITTTFAQIRTSGTTIRPAFEQMKKALKDTEAKIKTAHATLVQAIASVKVSDHTTATTTPTN